MSGPAHSPAPFRVGHSGIHYLVMDRLGRRIGFVPRNVPGRSCAEQEANLRLQLAGPEMLAALKAAEQFIVNGVELGFIRMPKRGDPALETLPAIRAAVELAATGESYS